MGALIAFIFLSALYFMPTIVAVGRGKANAAAIGALNFFLGWSVIGWIVSLVWALAADAPTQYINVQQNAYMPPGGPYPPGTYDPRYAQQPHGTDPRYAPGPPPHQPGVQPPPAGGQIVQQNYPGPGNALPGPGDTRGGA